MSVGGHRRNRRRKCGTPHHVRHRGIFGGKYPVAQGEAAPHQLRMERKVVERFCTEQKGVIFQMTQVGNRESPVDLLPRHIGNRREGRGIARLKSRLK